MRFRSLLVLACAVPLLVAGCGDPPRTQFELSTGTKSLAPPARKAIAETLLDHFGTPDALVAWPKLPVDYGQYTGRVAEAPQTNALTDVVLIAEFDSVPEEVDRTALLWTSGANQGKSVGLGPFVPVGEKSPQRGDLFMTGDLQAPPAAGDQFVAIGHRLQQGRVVYMKNCVHCHGTSGSGDGPTAEYLTPKPRDYRLGKFKFTSTHSTERASRDDLSRVVRYGIPGTYMPAFALLNDEQIAAVVEYVRWLAMRGEVEKRLVDELAGDFSEEAIREAGRDGRKERLQELSDYLEEDYADSFEGTVEFIAESWQRADAEESVVLPKEGRNAAARQLIAWLGENAEALKAGEADAASAPDEVKAILPTGVSGRELAELAARPTDLQQAVHEASVARGRQLYMSDRTKCYTCHGPEGRGDGSAAEDFWKKPGSTEEYIVRGLHDDWGQPLRPRDLTRGIYRGGRRPVDIYRRVYAGIKGTPMPAFGGTVLSDREIWDLVNYVMDLPFNDRPQSPASQSSRELAAKGTP